MCWNEPVSWITFVFGVIFSIILFVYGHKARDKNIKAIAVMWLFAIFMQLFEALLHRDNGKCSKLGRLASHGAFWANILQPAIVVIAILLFGIDHFRGPQIITLVVLIIYLTLMIGSYIKKGLRCVKKKCHIDLYWWGWNRFSTVLYFVSLFMSIYFFIQNDNGLRNFSLAFILSTLVLSLFYRQSPSIWCWFAVLGPLATLIYLKVRHGR